MNNGQKNQDPNFYSRDYYLHSCAGSDVFTFGEESSHALYSYIFEKMHVDVKGKKVLDLGCGRGELCISSMRRGASKVVGLDFSQAAVEIANEHLEKCDDLKGKEIKFIQGNALELNLETQFDVIFLTDIVEHLFDDQLKILFAKVHSHLATGGIVVIHTMPTKEFMIFGQFLKFFLYLLKGKKYHFLTFKAQAAETHVNLHHKEQLKRNLHDFDCTIWYDFADDGPLKRIISKTPLVRLVSGNLWAIATHRKNF